MQLEDLKGVDRLGSAKVRVPETSLAAAKAIDFCDVWPVAKAVLETLGKKVPALAFVVSILVKVGDSVCGGA